MTVVVGVVVGVVVLVGVVDAVLVGNVVVLVWAAVFAVHAQEKKVLLMHCIVFVCLLNKY